jgi:protein-S-isoprenylcysteine O-methyltransferase Ste14
MAIFKLSVWNAWLLSVPFVALGFLFMGMKKDIARRMSDMTGYNRKEKVFTVTASLASYPLMIGTIWTPFTAKPLFLYIGLLIYIIGMALFAGTLRAIIQTPHDEPFRSGPYGYTRNPLYVAATTVFIGICFATANIILSGYLMIAILLQHFMILAEERVCREKYGTTFEEYLKEVPRYLII